MGNEWDQRILTAGEVLNLTNKDNILLFVCSSTAVES